MEMEIKYQLVENLFVQKYSGIFSFEKYIAFTRYIVRYFASKSIKKVLIDFREFTFSDKAQEIPEDFNDSLGKVIEFRKHINETELKNKDVILVIWVDKPIPTVIAELFTANFSNKNYHYCSTKENAIEILKLPQHLNDIESIIDNLENTFVNK